MQKRKSREAGEVTVIGTGRGPRNSGPPSLTSPDRRSRDSLPARLFFQTVPPPSASESGHVLVYIFPPNLSARENNPLIQDLALRV